MFTRNWTIGVEYDYYTFESKDVSALRSDGAATDRWTVKPDNIQSVTGRVNFKFN
jgi:opacity protein-like surface antigen